MFSVFLSDILYAKKFEEKGERYWLPVVFPIAVCEAPLPVSTFF